ncbi:MAG: hypothetical protein HKM24_06620, partial [Gammaproteobacteria bacterium]|nr:hypothetical protein [Gammaproteobacteria bacterium]
MNELRWILLIAGVGIIAWVIWASRREFTRREQQLRQQTHGESWQDGQPETPDALMSVDNERHDPSFDSLSAVAEGDAE